MSINSVVSALLVPPAGLAVVALLALVVLRGRVGRVLAGLALVGLVLLSLPVVSMTLLASLEVPEQPHQAAGAIMVLGGDVDRIAEPPGASIGALSLERVRAGAALRRRTGLPVLITGGIVGDLPVAVGTLMTASMQDEFGIPVRWTEAASLTTWENARLSAPLLRDEGIDRLLLVTHAWHMRRSLLAMRRAGLDAVPAPVRRDPWPTGRAGEFLPSTGAWRDSFFAMHEWIGLAYYAMRP